jgi:hypothetical protein
MSHVRHLASEIKDDGNLAAPAKPEVRVRSQLLLEHACVTWHNNADVLDGPDGLPRYRLDRCEMKVCLGSDSDLKLPTVPFRLYTELRAPEAIRKLFQVFASLVASDPLLPYTIGSARALTGFQPTKEDLGDAGHRSPAFLMASNTQLTGEFLKKRFAVGGEFDDSAPFGTAAWTPHNDYDPEVLQCVSTSKATVRAYSCLLLVGEPGDETYGEHRVLAIHTEPPLDAPHVPTEHIADHTTLYTAYDVKIEDGDLVCDYESLECVESYQGYNDDIRRSVMSEVHPMLDSSGSTMPPYALMENDHDWDAPQAQVYAHCESDWLRVGNGISDAMLNRAAGLTSSNKRHKA